MTFLQPGLFPPELVAVLLVYRAWSCPMTRTEIWWKRTSPTGKWWNHDCSCILSSMIGELCNSNEGSYGRVCEHSKTSHNLTVTWLDFHCIVSFYTIQKSEWAGWRRCRNRVTWLSRNERVYCIRVSFRFVGVSVSSRELGCANHSAKRNRSSGPYKVPLEYHFV